MEGSAYPPPTQIGPFLTSEGSYYPAPQQFKDDNPPPPPYYGQAAPPVSAQQNGSSNIVVIREQPSVVRTTYRPPGDHFLTLSIVLTILCVICGGWMFLVCTIPAIVFATIARDAEARGDDSSAHTNGRIALGLNIGALAFWIMGFIGSIIAIAIGIARLVNSAKSYDCYYSYAYEYYYCYK